MSGWVHKCSNGVRLVVRHGDMSGMVEVCRPVSVELLALIPGRDILKLVSDFARSEQLSVAESEIDVKTDEQVLGIRRMPGDSA